MGIFGLNFAFFEESFPTSKLFLTANGERAFTPPPYAPVTTPLLTATLNPPGE